MWQIASWIWHAVCPRFKVHVVSIWLPLLHVPLGILWMLLEVVEKGRKKKVTSEKEKRSEGPKKERRNKQNTQ